MLENSVFVFALLAVIFDPSVGESAQGCTDKVKSRLDSLLAMDDSIRDSMCDLNQEHAKCVYMAENRRRSTEESSNFVELLEDALMKAGETGRICEVDWDAIMGGESNSNDEITEEEQARVDTCTTDYAEDIQEMARRDAGLSESEYCKVKNKVIQCVLNAMNRRPTQEEINRYSELLKAGEQQIGLECDVDYNAAVEEHWKGRENGGNGLIFKSGLLFNLLWLFLVSMAAHSLV